MFHTVFCQNTFIQFKKTRLYNRSIKEVLKDSNNNNKISDIGDTIDTNQVKKSGFSNLATRPNKFQGKL